MQAQLVETAELVTSEGPEDDKPSSPMVASPAAGQSAGPSVTASGELKSSERLCAFCCCGGRSLLGQGDLQVFSVAPELCVPHHRRRDGEGGGGGSGEGGGGGSSAGDDGGGDESPHSSAAPQATSGQRDKSNGSERREEEPDPASRFWDELSHHCAYCKRLGASIKCCAEGCAQLYHYPCAGAAGTHQDIRSLSLLCPDHVQLAIHRCKEPTQENSDDHSSS
ncbi:hypothetical protein CRUP_035782 [Coryphaenoides rupestris]|nr:hypothetical protein CRUP_035782 [Coryphaenoides rupestris]